MTKINRDTVRPFRKVHNDLSGFSDTEKLAYIREQTRLRRKKRTEKAKQERDRIRPFRKVRNDLSGFSETEKLAYIREQGRLRRKKATENARQARKDMTPIELQNIRDKWSADARKAYMKATQDMTPIELLNLKDKWRAKTRKAYEKAKDARKDMTPIELLNLKDRWRAKARKAHDKELLGLLPNATETEKLFAHKKKEQRRIKQKELYHSTIQRRLKAVLRSRLRSALRNNQKTGSAINNLGCSIDLLKDYLERNFLTGMTWENFGNKDGCWCIDHIYPISKADLTDTIQLKAVCNWKNLMPLWHTDNVKKKDVVTTESKRLFEMLRKMVS